MKNKKLLLPFVTLALLCVMFSSCGDDDDYYFSPLIGEWVLVSDDAGPVDYDQAVFQLYEDGNGTYTSYEWGDPYTYYIYWETDGDILYINFDDGQQWAYVWSVAGDYLYLHDVDTGSRLTFMYC